MKILLDIEERLLAQFEMVAEEQYRSIEQEILYLIHEAVINHNDDRAFKIFFKNAGCLHEADEELETFRQTYSQFRKH